MAITFPQLYAREGVIGDSKTDPILTAFDRMAPALQGEPLHTAMNAMMQGMAADPSAIISTLDGRLVALDEALVTEKEKSQTRIDTRTKILAASKEEIGAAIRELERQIAELRQQLDEKERNTTQSNAQDIGATEAYVQNVATERTCLVALKTFLEGGRT
jgi:phage-related minor tail protein